jgi:hypothetical protein
MSAGGGGGGEDDEEALRRSTRVTPSEALQAANEEAKRRLVVVTTPNKGFGLKLLARRDGVNFYPARTVISTYGPVRAVPRDRVQLQWRPYAVNLTRAQCVMLGLDPAEEYVLIPATESVEVSKALGDRAMVCNAPNEDEGETAIADLKVHIAEEARNRGREVPLPPGVQVLLALNQPLYNHRSPYHHGKVVLTDYGDEYASVLVDLRAAQAAEAAEAGARRICKVPTYICGDCEESVITADKLGHNGRYRLLPSSFTTRYEKSHCAAHQLTATHNTFFTTQPAN